MCCSILRIQRGPPCRKRVSCDIQSRNQHSGWTRLSTRVVSECGGQGRNRTADASLFRAALYRLSYLANVLNSLDYQNPGCLLPLPKQPYAPPQVSSAMIKSALAAETMSEQRLGDVIDDHCIKCRRITNHSIVSIIEDKAAKVRCRTCYHDHDYRHEQAPPTKKELKRLEAEAQAALAAAAGENAPGTPAIDETAEPALKSRSEHA